jgi:hypothetical protein
MSYGMAGNIGVGEIEPNFAITNITWE